MLARQEPDQSDWTRLGSPTAASPWTLSRAVAGDRRGWASDASVTEHRRAESQGRLIDDVAVRDMGQVSEAPAPGRWIA